MTSTLSDYKGGKVGDAFRAMPFRPALPMNRANLRCLGLSVGIAIALAGCGKEPEPRKADYGILRIKLFQQCLASAKDVTPKVISDRGSWSEVVEQCSDASYYQANTCDDERACLDAINASGMSAGTAETQRGSGLQPASPVGEAETPRTDRNNP